MAHYLEKAGTIVGVRAVALLAGLPEDFKQQCYIGRTQVPVPEAWVDMLLPGIFTLQRELRAQVQQASSKRDVDYSEAAGFGWHCVSLPCSAAVAAGGL